MQICWSCTLTETDTDAGVLWVAGVAVVSLDDDDEKGESDEELCNSPGHGRKENSSDLRVSDEPRRRKKPKCKPCLIVIRFFSGVPGVTILGVHYI